MGEWIRKGAGVLSPALGCAVFRHWTELLLLVDDEGRSDYSNLILDVDETGSCKEFLMYDKCERAYPGCRVHAPVCDLAFLVVHDYLPLLGAEPQTRYSDFSIWGAMIT